MQLLSSRSLAREVASPVIATLGLGRGTKASHYGEDGAGANARKQRHLQGA